MNETLTLPGIGESCNEYFRISYSGHNHILSSHKIEIREYAASLGGYDGFVKHIAKDILRANVTVSVASEHGGSFESFVHIALESMDRVASVVGILAFFGFSAKSMGEALSRVQSGIISKCIKHHGNVKELIDGYKKFVGYGG